MKKKATGKNNGFQFTKKQIGQIDEALAARGLPTHKKLRAMVGKAEEEEAKENATTPAPRSNKDFGHILALVIEPLELLYEFTWEDVEEDRQKGLIRAAVASLGSNLSKLAKWCYDNPDAPIADVEGMVYEWNVAEF